MNKNNLREARALEILQRWRGEGFSNRYIFVEALLSLDGIHLNNEASTLGEIAIILNQANYLLEQINECQLTKVREKETVTRETLLSSEFLSSIKDKLKPGIKLE